MSGLLLGIRVNVNEFQKLQIEEVDFDSKIDTFKSFVSEKTNISKDHLGNLCSIMFMVTYFTKIKIIFNVNQN